MEEFKSNDQNDNPKPDKPEKVKNGKGRLTPSTKKILVVGLLLLAGGALYMKEWPVVMGIAVPLIQLLGSEIDRSKAKDAKQ